MEYIQNKLWDKVESSKTKIAKRVYNQLNKDILYVVLDGDVFWFEKVCSTCKIPDFVYDYAKRFYKGLGFRYNYDN
jgi:hypothetical protein